MMLRSTLRKEWEDRVEEYSRSNLSAREWCEQNGFSLNQLRYWLKRMKEGSENGGWACVEVVDKDERRSAVSIHVGAARIEVHSGFDSSLLCEVLRVVAKSC